MDGTSNHNPGVHLFMASFSKGHYRVVRFLVSVKGTDEWVSMDPTQESAKVRQLITLYDKNGHWPTESNHVSRPNFALQNPTIPAVAPSNATRKVPEKPPIVPTSDDVLYGNRTKHNKLFKQLISSVKDSDDKHGGDSDSGSYIC